jgi:hypothetical protein
MARIAVDGHGTRPGSGVSGRLIHASHGQDLQWLVVTDGDDPPGEVAAACRRRWGHDVFTASVEAFDPDTQRFRTMTLVQGDPQLAGILQAEVLRHGHIPVGLRRFRILPFTHFKRQARGPSNLPSFSDQLRAALRSTPSATRLATFELLLSTSQADAAGHPCPGPLRTQLLGPDNQVTDWPETIEAARVGRYVHPLLRSVLQVWEWPASSGLPGVTRPLPAAPPPKPGPGEL